MATIQTRDSLSSYFVSEFVIFCFLSHIEKDCPYHIVVSYPPVFILELFPPTVDNHAVTTTPHPTSNFVILFCDYVLKFVATRFISNCKPTILTNTCRFVLQQLLLLIDVVQTATGQSWLIHLLWTKYIHGNQVAGVLTITLMIAHALLQLR